MKKYSSYKDSGVKWLGIIPSHWEVKRFRYILEENTNQNTDLKIRNQLQFRYGEIVPKEVQGDEQDVLDTIKKYTVVNPEDIMINGLNLNYDFISQRIAQVKENGVITSAYISLRPKPGVNSKYYTYFMKAMDAQKMFHGMGSGVRLTLSYENLKNLFFPFPPLDEQKAIVAYLDSAISKIDEAIAKQQRMIDLLNERKQIIIDSIISKGLNKSIKLKSSGNAFIGEIPSHWECYKTLYTLSMPITDGPHETPELFDSGIPFISAEAVSGGFIDFSHMRGYISLNFYNECCKKYTPQINDIYMIKSGASTGRSAIVETDKTFTIWSPLAVFRANKEIIDPYFLLFSLRSSFYQKQVEIGWSYGTQQNISMRTLEKIRLCVPPKNEQIRIVHFIKERTNKIEQAISCAANTISLLLERKQIIIYEVVNGKIKVS